MIADNSLKTRVIPSELASIDKIRLTLQTEPKNMWVSVRNYDLFSKNVDFRAFRQRNIILYYRKTLSIFLKAGRELCVIRVFCFWENKRSAESRKGAA